MLSSDAADEANQSPNIHRQGDAAVVVVFLGASNGDRPAPAVANAQDSYLALFFHDCVEDQVRIAHDGQHANAGLVGDTTHARKVAQPIAKHLDSLDNLGCGARIALHKVAMDILELG